VKRSKALLLGLVSLLLFARPLVSGAVYPLSNFYIALACVCGAALALQMRRGIGKGPFHIPVLVLVVLGWLSLIWSVDKGITFRWAIAFTSYGLIYLVMTNLGEEDIGWVCLAIAVGLIIMGGYGLYQYYVTIPETRELLYKAGVLARSQVVAGRVGDVRVSSTFVLPTSFAGYLVLALPVVGGWVFSSRGMVERIAGTLALVLGVWALVLTFSKGGWLIFALQGVVLAIIVMRRLKRDGVFLWIVGLIIILVGAGAWKLGMIEKGKLSAMARLDYWRAAGRIFREYPLSGTGMGSFGIVYPSYKLPWGEETQFAHNDYLQLAGELGIAGFAAFASMAVLLILKMREALRKGWVGTGVWLGMLGFFLHCGMDFDLYVVGTGFLAFAMLGWMGSMAGHRESPIYGRALPVILVGIIIFAVAAGIGLVGEWFYEKGDRAAVAAEECKLLGENVVDNVVRGGVCRLLEMKYFGVEVKVDYEKFQEGVRKFGGRREGLVWAFLKNAQFYLERGVRVIPWDARVWGRIGAVYAMLGSFEEDYFDMAERAYKNAIKRSPHNPVLYRALGEFFVAQGNLEEGAKYLEETVRLYPTKALYWIKLGKLYRQMEDFDRAEEAFRRALELRKYIANPDERKALESIYEEIEDWMKKEVEGNDKNSSDPRTKP